MFFELISKLRNSLQEKKPTEFHKRTLACGPRAAKCTLRYGGSSSCIFKDLSYIFTMLGNLRIPEDFQNYSSDALRCLFSEQAQQ